MADCPSNWLPIGNPAHSLDNECLVNPSIDIPMRFSITSISDDYTLLTTDAVVIFNIATAKIATLIDPTTNNEQAFSVVNQYDSVGNLTFSHSINNDDSFTLLGGENVTVISNGIEYIVYQ